MTTRVMIALRTFIKAPIDFYRRDRLSTENIHFLLRMRIRMRLGVTLRVRLGTSRRIGTRI